MKVLKLLIVMMGIFLVTSCGSTDYSKLEKNLTTKAEKYFNDNIKGYVRNVKQQQVTLKAMKAANIDIKEFTDEKCDEEDSYALIKFELDDDGNLVGDLTVENHLVCGSYTTEAK